MKKLTALAGALLMSVSSVSMADWTLDNENSRLNYITHKASAISEINSFTSLSGDITSAGKASLEIDLNSVETKIDIRNQRMRDIVFKVDQNAKAKIQLDVSNIALAKMAKGDHLIQNVSAELSLAGTTKTVNAQLLIVKTSEGSLLVSTLTPILLNGASFNLLPAIEELRKLAGLSAINPNISVSFSLVYQ